METILNGQLCIYCRNFVSKYFRDIYSSTKTWKVRYGIVQGKFLEYTIKDSILTVKSMEHDSRYKIERISKDSLVIRDSEWHPIFSITNVLKLVITDATSLRKNDLTGCKAVDESIDNVLKKTKRYFFDSIVRISISIP